MEGKNLNINVKKYRQKALDLLMKSEIINNQDNLKDLGRLHAESDEIARILSSIINSARKTL